MAPLPLSALLGAALVASGMGACFWVSPAGCWHVWVPAAACRCRALGTHCTRAFPSLTVHLWGTEEVAAWLEHLSLCEYKDIFTRHDIRGSELLHLERRDLKVLP